MSIKKRRFVKKTQQHIKKSPSRKSKPTAYIMHDVFFKKAKQEGYRARSVYKLKEIQEKFWIIQSHMSICDVWAAPGSFLQYIGKIIQSSNLLIGIDIKTIDSFSQDNIYTLQCSIFDFKNVKQKVEQIFFDFYVQKKDIKNYCSQFDIIISDIAPNTTWRKDVDQYASVELNIEILKFSDIFLIKGWNLLLKVFKGEDFWDLTSEIHKRFEKFTEYKPLACRDRSFEIYLICFSKK